MTIFTNTVLSNLGVDQFYNLIIFINIDEIFQCLIEIFSVNRTVVAQLRLEVELFCVPILDFPMGAGNRSTSNPSRSQAAPYFEKNSKRTYVVLQSYISQKTKIILTTPNKSG